MLSPATSVATPPPRAAPLRTFARFRLLRLMGKSGRTMSWLVDDTREGRELLLVLPRSQVVDAAAAQRWVQVQRQVSRLAHPNVAPLVEIGVHDSWPYAAYDVSGTATLTERIGNVGLAAAEAVAIANSALQGLAYAHDAGMAHHDLQASMLLVGEDGQVRLVGLEVALHASTGPDGERRAQREAAERDVLCVGLLLQHALVGHPALDLADTGQIIERMPPQGHESVRLPWSTRQPIPEVLRAIVNRATDRQASQRYRSARTLARALEGWLHSDEQSGGGPLALLLDRLSTVGLLPSRPGAGERVARLALMDRQRTNEMAGIVLEDPALAFELLRNVNSAQHRNGSAGTGPVVTVRRATSMLGMDTLRRSALALRAWPGALAQAHVPDMEQLFARVMRAGRIAVALCPAGYDAEVVYVLTLLQNTGRLIVQYHCADEAAQIRRLMQPVPAEEPGQPPTPGMSEEAAAFSVLGVDHESIGAAIARRWGVDDTIAALLRRWPLTQAVRPSENDHDLLRSVASCANELMDLSLLPPAQHAQALQRIAARYARALHVGVKEMQTALQESSRTRISEVLAAANGNAFYTSGLMGLEGR